MIAGTFVDIARMIGVDTPLIDAMIRWNQKLIGKEYMTATGHIDGAHVDGSIILALPTDFPFEGGGVTVWEQQREGTCDRRSVL